MQKKLGPAWTDRGCLANGYFTKRTAEDWLRTTLEQARRGELPGMVRTGASLADACEEFLRYVTEDRARHAPADHQTKTAGSSPIRLFGSGFCSCIHRASGDDPR